MTINALRELSRSGVLRRLDSAFAAFMAELDPNSGPPVVMAAAMLSRLEGLGHVCLPLTALCQSDSSIFAWTERTQAVSRLWFGLPSNIDDWTHALASSLVVFDARRGSDQGQPLVLDGPADAPRLYLRRYWGYERTVAAALRDRSARHVPVDETRVRDWLDRLFSDLRDDGRNADIRRAAAAIDWQRIACAIAVRGALTVITGGPGTGKTFTAARLLALLFATSTAPERLRIALAAPTGKAAARLRQSIDRAWRSLPASRPSEPDLHALGQRIGPARTLHALLGAGLETRRFRHHAGNPLPVDVVIVDEASMIHLEMMAALLDALAPNARLVLIGDKDQLASVEAGAVLGDLCAGAQQIQYNAQTAGYLQHATGQTLPVTAGLTGDSAALLAQQTVMLQQSRRFDGPIGDLARSVNDATDIARPRELLRGDSGGALFLGEDGTLADIVAQAVGGRKGAEASYRIYLERLQRPPAPGDAEGHARWAVELLRDFDRFRVLCAVREGDWGVAGLNPAIERALERQGLLTPNRAWYRGRPIMVTRNDPSLGVFNGDIGIALPACEPASGLRVYFLDGDRARSVSTSRLANVETSFALTVHKSQGSEYEHTALVLAAHCGNVLTRELIYTGITRASRAFTLIAQTSGLLEEGVRRVTRRASGLRD